MKIQTTKEYLIKIFMLVSMFALSNIGFAEDYVWNTALRKDSPITAITALPEGDNSAAATGAGEIFKINNTEETHDEILSYSPDGARISQLIALKPGSATGFQYVYLCGDDYGHQDVYAIMDGKPVFIGDGSLAQKGFNLAYDREDDVIFLDTCEGSLYAYEFNPQSSKYSWGKISDLMGGQLTYIDGVGLMVGDHQITKVYKSDDEWKIDSIKVRPWKASCSIRCLVPLEKILYAVYSDGQVYSVNSTTEASELIFSDPELQYAFSACADKTNNTLWVGLYPMNKLKEYSLYTFQCLYENTFDSKINAVSFDEEAQYLGMDSGEIMRRRFREPVVVGSDWRKMCWGDSISDVTVMSQSGGSDFIWVGDAAGNVYHVNAVKSVYVGTVPTEKAITSLVNTSGKVEMGDFACLSNGKIYLFKDDGFRDVSCTDSTGNVISICYDMNNGLFCGTDKGYVYHYELSVSGWLWVKVSSDEMEKTGYSADYMVSNSSLGLFVGSKNESSGYIYQLKSLLNNKVQWKGIDLKDNHGITSMSDASSNGIIICFANRTIFMFNGELNALVSSQFGNPSVAYNKITNELYIGSVGQNLVEVYNFTAEKFYSYTLPQPLSNVGAWNSEMEFVACPDSIYYNFIPKKSALTASARYVSRAAIDPTSKTHKDDSVYQITIQGEGFNLEDMFSKGANGYRYELECYDATGSHAQQYDSVEYPLTGVKYFDNGGSLAVMNPREVSFQWLGPACSKDGDFSLVINQYYYGYDSASGKQVKKTLHSIKIGLPAKEAVEEIGAGYTMVLSQISANKFSNGTCAIPLNLVINKNGNPVSDTDDIYNHIAFYAYYNSDINRDHVIGSNPNNPDNNCVAVLTNDSVEINGKVKYGSEDDYRGTDHSGRHYYMFLNGREEVRIVACLIDDLDSANKIEVKREIVATPDKALVKQQNVGLNEPRNVTLYDRETERVSNYAGDDEGNYRGMLDYIFADGKIGVESKSGVFGLMPEGLSPNDLPARLNFMNSKTGFYFRPVGIHGTTAERYDLRAMGSYCRQTNTSGLYFVLFDQYGRYVKDVVQSQGNKGSWDEDMTLTVCNYSKVPMIIRSSDSGVADSPSPIQEDGAFIPPSGKMEGVYKDYTNNYSRKQWYNFCNNAWNVGGTYNTFSTRAAWHPNRDDTDYAFTTNESGWILEKEYLPQQKIKGGVRDRIFSAPVAWAPFVYNLEVDYKSRDQVVSEDRVYDHSDHPTKKIFKYSMSCEGSKFRIYSGYSPGTTGKYHYIDFDNLTWDDHK